MMAAMPSPRPLGSRLVATGHYQSGRVVTNDDLAQRIDTSDEWIRRRVGIKSRWVAEESLVDLAAGAGRMALEHGSVDASTIDLVIVATCTALDRIPNTAAEVAARLELTGSPAVMDVNVACSGFTHALALADHAIKAGSARRALVVGAERMTDFTDWDDRSTAVLLGDGAGAAVLEASESEDIGPVVWGSQPEMADAVRIRHTDDTFAQEGQSVFRWTTTTMPAVARQICERTGIEPSDLDAVVLHQANLRIILPIARSLGLREDAVVATDVEESGNTSAASVPLALSKLVHAGSVPSGGRALLLGFGGGLAWAGQVVRLP